MGYELGGADGRVVTATIGVGIYLVIGAVVATIAAAVLLFRRRQRTPRIIPAPTGHKDFTSVDDVPEMLTEWDNGGHFDLEGSKVEYTRTNESQGAVPDTLKCLVLSCYNKRLGRNVVLKFVACGDVGTAKTFCVL